MGVTVNRVAGPAAIAERVGPIVALLRTLAGGAAAALPSTERLDAKVALAGHLRDDAAAAAGLAGRLRAYGAAVPEPHPAPPGPWIEVAYDDLKPQLADAVAVVADAIDPLLAEPVARLLETVRADQARHRDERPASAPGLAAGAPAPGGAAADLRDVLHACVASGERAAREFLAAEDVTAAERAWTHLRHAAALDRLLSTRFGLVAPDVPAETPADDPALLARAWRELHGAQHPDVTDALALILAEL